MTAPSFLCGAAILAAGASSRMGQPKPLLAWGEHTVIGHLTSLYRRLAGQVRVVCRADDAPLVAELDRIGVPPSDRVFNLEAASGMFSSVKVALHRPGWRDGTTHIVLALVDQPQINPESIARLLEAARSNPDRIIQPLYEGRRRHPIVFPVILAPLIAGNARFETLRDALHAHHESVVALQVADSGLTTDLDTPAQYDAAVNRFLPNPP